MTFRPYSIVENPSENFILKFTFPKGFFGKVLLKGLLRKIHLKKVKMSAIGEDTSRDFLYENTYHKVIYGKISPTRSSVDDVLPSSGKISLLLKRIFLNVVYFIF